jgi:hypothetical protein
MAEDDLLTIQDVARLAGAPPKFVLQTLDRDGIKPIAEGGNWLERHKLPNLRWRRSEIEAWLDRQES